MIEDVFKTATPYILAASGGLFPELCGTLNIALEGQILIGAFWAIAAVNITGSLLFGFISAIIASSLLAIIVAFFSFRFKANVFISGLAGNLLAYGLVSVFHTMLFETSGVIRAGIYMQNYTFFFLMFAIISVPICYYIINITPFGMRCRAAGLSEIALYYKGINPVKYRYGAFLISGIMCGIAGAAIASRIGAFVPNISAGRGWIALVAIYMGYKKIHWVFLSCLVFAIAENIANWSQASLHIPATIILSFPYIITLIILTISSAFRKQ